MTKKEFIEVLGKNGFKEFDKYETLTTYKRRGKNGWINFNLLDDYENHVGFEMYDDNIHFHSSFSLDKLFSDSGFSIEEEDNLVTVYINGDYFTINL